MNFAFLDWGLIMVATSMDAYVRLMRFPCSSMRTVGGLISCFVEALDVAKAAVEFSSACEISDEL